jgi:hypothetical protein
MGGGNPGETAVIGAEDAISLPARKNEKGLIPPTTISAHFPNFGGRWQDLRRNLNAKCCSTPEL